jgi:hypothetical protein
MDLLQAGQKLSINIVKHDKLVEIMGTIAELYDDRMSIELPPYFMRYIEFLDVGKKLTIRVFSKLGTIDFNTIVITSPLEEGNFEIELDYNALKLTPGPDIPVIKAIENLQIIFDENVYTTQTIEISTEYIKFYSDKKLNVDESFDCVLLLSEDYGKIKFKVNITEVDKIYDTEYTASYFSMSESDREALLYYMYVYSANQENV